MNTKDIEQIISFRDIKRTLSTAVILDIFVICIYLIINSLLTFFIFNPFDFSPVRMTFLFMPHDFYYMGNTYSLLIFPIFMIALLNKYKLYALPIYLISYLTWELTGVGSLYYTFTNGTIFMFIFPAFILSLIYILTRFNVIIHVPLLIFYWFASYQMSYFGDNILPVAFTLDNRLQAITSEISICLLFYYSVRSRKRFYIQPNIFKINWKDIVYHKKIAIKQYIDKLRRRSLIRKWLMEE